MEGMNPIHTAVCHLQPRIWNLMLGADNCMLISSTTRQHRTHRALQEISLPNRQMLSYIR